jgi:anhydro-N-acetylmuramic acid kinase
MLYLGMMSGTSLDGIDAVLAEIVDIGADVKITSIGSFGQPFSPLLLSELQALQAPCNNELHRSYCAANLLADEYATVALAVLARSKFPAQRVMAIGAHGQTVRHRPGFNYSIQLLNGSRLAEKTQIDVACDFRAADLSAGGEGAPLAPAFHAEVFAHATIPRCIVNIGGIGNVSFLSPKEEHQPAAPIGFDTGPGNTLMDYWCQRHLEQAFDKDGAWAATGIVHEGLLARFLSDQYFQRDGPKSTGRDLFNAPWLNVHLRSMPAISACDVQATLLELTAQTIAQPIRRLIDQSIAGRQVAETYVCGGGAFNKALMKRLSQLIAPSTLATTHELGVDPQSVEALAFAWLAYKRLKLQPANLPSVTSAKGLRILGALHKAHGV